MCEQEGIGGLIEDESEVILGILITLRLEESNDLAHVHINSTAFATIPLPYEGVKDRVSD